MLSEPCCERVIAPQAHNRDSRRMVPNSFLPSAQKTPSKVTFDALHSPIQARETI